jgi:site-specific recombinase XerD
MTSTAHEGEVLTLEQGLAAFLNALLAKNRSSATIRAYTTDVQQFITYLHENNVAITVPADVQKVDVLEYRKNKRPFLSIRKVLLGESTGLS